MKFGSSGFRALRPETHESVNPFIIRGFSRCILCGRCAQECNDIQVNHAIDFGYRGLETKIVESEDHPFGSNVMFTL